MEKRDYLNKVSQVKLDSKKVNEINKLYGAVMPDLIQRIVSYGQEAIFFDDGVRILSFEEIIDAEKDLHVEFARKGIIPIADCGENDFIVYHFNDNIWSKFNIVDESVFKKKKSIDELLK